MSSPSSEIGNEVCEDKFFVDSVLADLSLGCIEYFSDQSVVVNPSNQISSLLCDFVCHCRFFEIVPESELELLPKP